MFGKTIEDMSALLPPLAGNYQIFSNPVCREGSVRAVFGLKEAGKVFWSKQVTATAQLGNANHKTSVNKSFP